MKKSKFIIYLFVVILGASVIDVGLRLAISPFFDNPPINTKAGATYKFVSHKAPSNIAILGASRASHHYRSEQIEDSLGLKVFNYGWDGRCTLYQYLCLLSAIEKGELKLAILDLSEAQLSNKWVNERMSDLYPYYWKNDTVQNMIDEVEGNKMKFLMLSSLIQYNSQYLNFIAPIEGVKGYVPLPYTGTALDMAKRQYAGNNELAYNEFAMKYLKRMSYICKEKDITFIVCLSPSLAVTKESESKLQALCDDMGVDYWNYTHLITDPILYSDYEHLNDRGAELFTNVVIKRLKEEYRPL